MMRRFKVGDVVVRTCDPGNKRWLDAGIREGSVGVVVEAAAPQSDLIEVRYLIAPSHTGKSHTRNIRLLEEVSDGTEV